MSDLEIKTHPLGNWAANPSYFERIGYRKDNNNTSNSTLSSALFFNSCGDDELTAQTVCSGNGKCVAWNPDDILAVFFCQCDRGFAGVVCNHKRPSQSIAWLWSLFLGYFGADEIYLGWYYAAAAKLFLTILGGTIALVFESPFGLLVIVCPWVIDVVRIGSGPVFCKVDGRVEDDLPRWAFAICTIVAFSMIGFAWVTVSLYYRVMWRRHSEDRANCSNSTVGAYHVHRKINWDIAEENWGTTSLRRW